MKLTVNENSHQKKTTKNLLEWSGNQWRQQCFDSSCIAKKTTHKCLHPFLIPQK
jgi:hypothetical protein